MADGVLRITVWSDADATERERILTRNGTLQSLTATGELTASIGRLLDDVRDRGDDALVDALRTFDSVETDTASLRITQEGFDEARAAVGPELREAISFAVARSLAFNHRIVERASWRAPDLAGGWIGEVGRPIESAGLFIPSGKGSFPSVLVQVGAPAVAAGVSKIAVVVPPMPRTGGLVDPATLVVAEELGLHEVYRLNGPSAIGALAYGTQTVPRVGKIVGPGSPAVAVAQQLVQASGTIVASGLGPTDSLIIADSTADARLLAVDLVNEAEHGSDSSAVLVSTDRELLEAVAVAAREHIDTLPEPRRGYALQSILRNGGLVLAQDVAEAVAVANEYASEHVQLAVEDPEQLLEQVRYAGTVLLGQWTTFASSNFVIGTPATLPTTGYAKSVSGVTAHTFLNSIATAHVTAEGFWELAHHIEALATHEGFPAHRATVTARREPPR